MGEKMESWFSTATRIPSLRAEICFLLKESLYYGPDRVTDIADFERLSEPLTLPEIPRVVTQLVRTTEAIGNEQELAAYYAQVIGAAQRHGLAFNSIRHHFWLRLWLWNEERGVRVEFPWYDSFQEIDCYLAALVDTESGLVDSDMDQGWQSDTSVQDDALFLRQCDPDSDETHVCISVPRDELVQQVRALRERTRQIISQLTGVIGVDVWTRYVVDEPEFRMRSG